MTDYTVTENYAIKDTLPANDPDKFVQGVELQADFDAIAVAIASKFDVSDIATQAQAEAGVSNSVLMTPLRTAQQLGGSTGGGAGIVGDLIDLADPGADRILFWDESVNAAAFLTVSTGLLITGTALTADLTTIDHDGLLNSVANEHIDHTAVAPLAGEGIAITGADLTTDFTTSIDIPGLTEELSVDLDNDDILFYDASATGHRRIPASQLVGASLGDAKINMGSNQTITSPESTVLLDTTVYNTLTRGTFSTVTGEYTATVDTRIYIYAQVRFDSLVQNQRGTVTIQVNGTDVVENWMITMDGLGGPSDWIVPVATTLSLTAADVVRIRAEVASASDDIVAGSANTFVSIMELS